MSRTWCCTGASTTLPFPCPCPPPLPPCPFPPRPPGPPPRLLLLLLPECGQVQCQHVGQSRHVVAATHDEPLAAQHRAGVARARSDTHPTHLGLRPHLAQLRWGGEGGGWSGVPHSTT